MSYRKVTAALLLFSCFFAIVACGSSGSGGSLHTPDVTPPIVTLLSPSVGQCVGHTRVIRWSTEDESVGTVKIELLGPGGTTTLADGLADSGSFSWDTTLCTDGDSYQVQVTATDSAGNRGNTTSTNGNIVLDNTAPTITLTAPTGGESWDGTRTVTWNTTENNRGGVLIELSADGGSTYSTTLTTATTDDGTFSFDTTPFPDGPNYRVRVTATDLADNVGSANVSAANFIIDNNNPVVALNSPTGGELLMGTHTVTWNSTEGNPGTVLVELSNNGGTSYSTLATVADTGSCSLNTLSQSDGNTYRLRLTPTDSVGNVGSTSSSATNFTIDNTNPVISLTAPTSGQMWRGTKNITWNTTDANPGTVLVEVSDDEGASFGAFQVSVPDTGSYSLNTTTLSDGATYRVRVTATDSAGNVSGPSVLAANFTIDNTAPVISLTSPDGGEVWRGSNNISWNTTDANPDRVNLELSRDNGSSFTTIAASAPDTGTFSFNTTLYTDAQQCLIRVTATDGAGNSSTAHVSASSFSIDNTAPTVSITAPTGSSNWSGTKSIIWTTSDPNPNVVTINYSTVSSAGPWTSLATNETDDGSYPFNTGLLDNSTSYYLQIVATDQAGNVGSAVTASSFTIFNLKVAGKAIYFDTNGNGQADSGDKITVPFSVPVTVNSADGASLSLPVNGDSLGTSASMSAGSVTNEVDITLGTNPSLKTRQVFSSSATAANSPSGIDVSATMAANAIESQSGGIDAVPSVPIDVAPGLVWSSKETFVSIDGAILFDANKDGKLDIFVIDNPCDLYINNGLGTFGYSDPNAGGGDFCTIGDFNNDGNDDVAIGYSSTVNVYFGLGDGTFTNSGQSLLAGVGANSVEAFDVDKDGDVDLLTGGPFLIKMLYINDGSGAFAYSGDGTFPITIYSTKKLKAIDLDNDGDFDVCELTPSTVYLWRNNGAGTFSTWASFNISGGSAEDIAFGDVDKDGDQDLVIGTDGSGAFVYKNNGSGAFTDSGQVLGAGNSTTLALCDYDNDGDLDLVKGASAASELWLNDGSGNYSQMALSLSPGSASTLWGDVDQDGDNDLVLVHNDQFNVWKNSLSGTWGALSYTPSAQSFGALAWSCVKTADMDKDGDIDIVSSVTTLFENDGAGNFSTKWTYSAANNSHVLLADVNRDSYLDYIHSFLTPQLSITYGYLDGYPIDPGYYYNQLTLGAAAGHINKDGIIDFFAVNGATKETIAFTGDSSYDYTPASIASHSNPYFVLSADFNRDFLADCVTLNKGLGTTADIMMNDGTGSFTAGQQLSSGVGLNSGCLGDVDNDGDVDLILGTLAGGPSLLYRYDHTLDTFGALNPGDMPADTHRTESLALADLDQDGDLDLILGNHNADNSIYLNTGIGVFTDSGYSFGNSSSTQWIAVADLDNDGDLDIIFAYLNDNLSIYFCN